MIERGNSLDRKYVASSNEAIAKRVTELNVFQAARSVFIYVSRGFEPDTGQLIRTASDSGKKIFVPFITGRGTMCAKYIDGFFTLEQGRFGIPTAPSDAPEARIDDIDLALIPCVSATRQGVRLGYGGGYYDRFFAGDRGKTAAYVLCREQMLSEKLPKDDHDVVFDGIITEKNIYFVDM